VLANATDVGGFAQVVADLLGDGAMRERRADAARLAAIERHDLDRAVVALEGVWERVASGGGRAEAA
jgi:hypothetical protein